MEAKKAAIEDCLKNFPLCKGPVEKVCLDPQSKYMFLDLDRLVQIGDKLLKAKPHTLVSMDDFLERLFQGDYHVNVSEELRDILHQTKDQRDSLEITFKADMQEIQSDMNDLCELIVGRVRNYFKELTQNLQDIHKKNTQHQRSELKKFEQLLNKKIEYRDSLGRDEFNLTSLHAKFKLWQKEPEKLESHFQSLIRRKTRYDAFREDKDLNTFQSLFEMSTNFEENVVTYLSNHDKLKFKFSQSSTPSSTLGAKRLPAEEKFAESVVDFIDETISSLKHFAIESAIKTVESPKLGDSIKSLHSGSILQTLEPPMPEVIEGSVTQRFEKNDWSYGAIEIFAKKLEIAQDIEIATIEIVDVLQIGGKSRIGRIMQEIAKHHTIRHLHLRFDRSKLTRSEIDEVIKCVESLPTLLEFSLSMSG
jgi:hypothetical protein